MEVASELGAVKLSTACNTFVKTNFTAIRKLEKYLESDQP